MVAAAARGPFRPGVWFAPFCLGEASSVEVARPGPAAQVHTDDGVWRGLLLGCIQPIIILGRIFALPRANMGRGTCEPGALQ
jgi:hypothetical protein